MSGDSLYTYKKEMIDANSNKGWQQYNSSVSSAGQMASYNTPLFNSASGYPSVAGWPNNWTSSDPTLNFGSTSTDLGGAAKVTEVLGWVMGGASALTGVMGLAAGITALCKKDKSAGSSADAADSTLANLVESANNYDKKSDKGQMQSTANSLTRQIKNVDTRLNTAKQNKATAEKTLANLSTQKNDWETKLSDFDTAKSGLESEIIDIDGQISALDPQSATYQADKERLEALKAEKQKQINDNYSEAKRKQITNQITRIEKEEEKWNVTLAEANQDISKLPKEKKEAEKALERLNKLINKN